MIRGQANTAVEGLRRQGVRGATGPGGVAEELERVAELCGRIELDAACPDLTRTLLEPIAAFVRADTASLRRLDTSCELGIPRHVASLGVPDSVGDAYVGRYHKLDPAKRLMRCSLDGPVFADPNRPGVWARETAAPSMMRRYREEFLSYLRGFLIPNDFAQHVGFCIRDGSAQVLVFDFHRGRRASPFNGCEVARSRAVARYLYARAANGWSSAVDEHRHPGADRQLSARELEVAEAVARGLSNKEVAATLGISVRTVENHMRSIFAKLGVSSRTRLAVELRRKPA